MAGPRFARLAVEVAPADLLRAAKERSGAATDADLARRLSDYGLDAVSTTRSIPRWRKGESQPQYAATLALLALAGWLNEDLMAAGLAAGEAARAEAMAEEVKRRERAEEESPAQDEQETG